MENYRSYLPLGPNPVISEMNKTMRAEPDAASFTITRKQMSRWIGYLNSFQRAANDEANGRYEAVKKLTKQSGKDPKHDTHPSRNP